MVECSFLHIVTSQCFQMSSFILFKNELTKLCSSLIVDGYNSKHQHLILGTFLIKDAICSCFKEFELKCGILIVLSFQIHWLVSLCGWVKCALHTCLSSCWIWTRTMATYCHWYLITWVFKSAFTVCNTQWCLQYVF